jgi:DNA-binding response OmpR family regulator
VIAVVDDDALQRAMLCDALAEQGFEVEPFPGAAAALAGLTGAAPELVVSDVVMPGMDGLAFRRAYAERFPARRTPFLLLSARGSDADQVRGLEAGADDYLVKPVAPALLAAKVRACLRRAALPPAAPVRAGPDDRPFAQVVEFCEAQGFSGHVEVVVEGRKEAVAFRDGRVERGGPERAAVVDRLLAVPRGFFLFRPQAVEQVAAPPEGAGEGGPAVRRSALWAGGRRLRVETEVSPGPRASVVSVAVLEGRTVFKRSSAARPGGAAGQVEAQHAAVEADLAARLSALVSPLGDERGDAPADAPAEASPVSPVDARATR